MNGKFNKELMLRLSKSSIDLLRQCEQKFVFKRGLELEPDYEDDKISLRFGSAVHKVLEDMEHFNNWTGTEEEEKLLLTVVASANELYSIPKYWGYCVHYSVLEYIKFIKGSGLKVVLIEVLIGDSVNSKGYVDLVAMDSHGYWHIIDIKTSASSWLKPEQKVATLNNNLQLGTYASPKHVRQLCDAAKEKGLEMKPEKLKSVRLRVVTKPIDNKTFKTVASLEDMAKVSKYVCWYEFILPIEELNIEAAEKTLRQAQARALELYEGSTPLRNENACFDFNNPCEHFSQCYGKTYAEMLAASKVEVVQGVLGDQSTNENDNEDFWDEF